MTTTRRLAAIMAADVAGFSAAMERDEEGTFVQVQELRRKIIEPEIAEHQGRLIKTTGDGFLAEFASPIAAVKCALAIQAAASGSLQLRIGLNLGDVIVEESGDVYGEGVNVAARLEALADPGGILISAKVHSEVEGKIGATFDDRGEQQVKNIARSVRAYAVGVVGVSSTRTDTLSTVGASKPLPLPDKPSIAVLPFQNMSGDPEQEYFADGMVEEIITALSRFKSLFVIARNSSFTYKGRAVDVKQVGRELGVRYLLEGSVRKAGGRLRITGQLIDTGTNNHLWADRFDGTLEDVFDLQDRLTSQVVGAIEPALLRAETERSSSKRPDSLIAYDLYLRALSELNKFTGIAAREALRLSYEAIAAEPTYGAAHAVAARCYGNLNIWDALTNDEREAAAAEALRLAERAIALANDDAEVLASCSNPIVGLCGQLERGIELLNRARAINPNLAYAWYMSGWTYIFAGSPDVGLDHCGRALRLSPTDARRPIMLQGMATASLLLGHFAEALDWMKKPYFESGYRTVTGLWTLAACAAQAGDLALAKKAIQELREIYPEPTLAQVRQYYEDKVRWRRQKDIERMIEGLRRAGLPE